MQQKKKKLNNTHTKVIVISNEEKNLGGVLPRGGLLKRLGEYLL